MCVLKLNLRLKTKKTKKSAKEILSQFDLKDKLIKELKIAISSKQCDKCGSTQKIIIKYHCNYCAKHSDVEYRSKDNE